VCCRICSSSPLAGIPLATLPAVKSTSPSVQSAPLPAAACPVLWPNPGGSGLVAYATPPSATTSATTETTSDGVGQLGRSDACEPPPVPGAGRRNAVKLQAPGPAPRLETDPGHRGLGARAASPRRACSHPLREHGCNGRKDRGFRRELEGDRDATVAAPRASRHEAPSACGRAGVCKPGRVLDS
jgi:hypothetical protein